MGAGALDPGDSMREAKPGQTALFGTKAQSEVMARELETIDAEGVSKQDIMESWRMILLFDKVVTYIGGDNSERLNNKLRTRLQAAKDGDWLDLPNELLEEECIERKHTTKTKDETNKLQAKIVISCAEEGSWMRG